MTKEFKTQKAKETIVYYEGIPEQIIEELSDEQRIQYFIWDEITKRMAKLFPRSLLPVIKEVFGKVYSQNVNIEFLSTEYAVDTNRGKGANVIHSIYADLVVRIGEKDVYHFECQIAPKGNMVIRMYEYDTQIALVHGVGIHKEDEKTFVEMPNSIILYLTHTKNTPDFERMEILLPDGKIWDYQVPVLKVQNYSLEMIKKKKLYFLIPLTTIRYYSAKTKKKLEIEECPFEQFLIGNIMIVKDAVQDGYLSDKTGRDILDLLNRGCQYLFVEDTGTLEVVKRIMEPVFKLGREIFEEEATERITQEVTERVTRQVTEDVTRQVTEDVTRQVTEDVTRQVTEDVTRQVTEDVTRQVTEDVTQQVEQNLLRNLMDNTNMTEEEAKKVLGIA